ESYQNGERVKVVNGYGSAKPATWTYAYDQNTLAPIAVTDPNGHTTTMSYDASGNMLSQTDPLGRTTSWTYNALNRPLTVTDPMGVATTSSYDNNNNGVNLTSVSRPWIDSSGVTQGTKTTTYTIDQTAARKGDVLKVTDPDLKIWSYSYDDDGNVFS